MMAYAGRLCNSSKNCHQKVNMGNVLWTSRKEDEVWKQRRGRAIFISQELSCVPAESVDIAIDWSPKLAEQRRASAGTPHNCQTPDAAQLGRHDKAKVLIRSRGISSIGRGRDINLRDVTYLRALSLFQTWTAVFRYTLSLRPGEIAPASQPLAKPSRCVRYPGPCR